MTPCGKPWLNLRSSRETELADRFPIQVVTAWIGYSVAVAKKHYLQVTDNHYDTAVGAGGGAVGANMVQRARASKSTNRKKTDVCESSKAPANLPAPPKGFEPLSSDGKSAVLGH